MIGVLLTLSPLGPCKETSNADTSNADTNNGHYNSPQILQFPKQAIYFVWESKCVKS